MVQTGYAPSSTEKKTAILLYLLVGIIIMLQKDRTTSWLLGHMHQALGWRLFVIVIALVSMVLLFIPFLSLIPIFCLIIVIGIGGWFVTQARSGVSVSYESGLSLFPSLGKRVADVMDVQIASADIIQEETSPTEPTS